MIKFPCPTCRRTIGIKDEHAGKRMKCPGCGASTTVPKPKRKASAPSRPKPAPAAAPVPDLGPQPTGEELLLDLGFDPDEPSASTTPTKSCPYCAEDVALNAIKCKHCGEFIKGPPSRGGARSRTGSRRKSNQGDAQTDPLAVITLMTGSMSLVILPIVFAPTTVIVGSISYYRLKENPNLKGGWMRLIGGIFGAIGFLMMMLNLGAAGIGPFKDLFY